MRKDLFNLTVEQLFKARLHFGYQKNKLNDKLIYYVLGNRHDITIFNLEKILYNLKIVYGAISEIVAQRGFFFLVSTKNDMTLDIILDQFFKKYNRKGRFNIIGLIEKKWTNGVFSNWLIIYDKIKYLKSIKNSKSIRNKDQLYLENLENVKFLKNKIIPDIVFLFNHDSDVIKELNNLNIPIIGTADSDTFIDNYLYALIGNNQTPESVIFFCQLIEDAVTNGKLKEQEQFLYYFILKLKKNILTSNE